MSLPGRAPQGARGLKSISIAAMFKASCRAPQGARGLKLSSYSLSLLHCYGRAPQGARGLKYFRSGSRTYEGRRSRPARGAWVEILSAWSRLRPASGRAPQGARGLKSRPDAPLVIAKPSRPARGAWVETLPGFRYRIPPQKGSLCRSAETSFSFSIFTCRSSGLRSRHFSRPGGPWRGTGLHRSAGSVRSRAHAGI